MTLRELYDEIQDIEITYDYDDTYSNLYNAVIDYENDSQDFSLDYLFEDIIDYEFAEERAKYELENGGLIRLYYFLGDINPNEEVFRINDYGNLSSITKDDLDYLKSEILDAIRDELDQEDEED